jgi:hypothetical protein
VQFNANGSALDSPVNVGNSGVASLSHTFNTAGTYAITATYSSSSHNATSQPLALNINAGGAAITSTSGDGGAPTVIAASTVSDAYSSTADVPLTATASTSTAHGVAPLPSSILDSAHIPVIQALGPLTGIVFGNAVTVWAVLFIINLAAMSGIFALRRRWMQLG